MAGSLNRKRTGGPKAMSGGNNTTSTNNGGRRNQNGMQDDEFADNDFGDHDDQMMDY